MKPLAEEEIRASFANCTQGEAKRAPMPATLPETPWSDLEFLGWCDLGAPDRAYLVTEHADRPLGITLRLSTSHRGFLHRSMCSLCLTTHPGSGVSLMTARKVGPAGRQGNSAGLYICTDLACSLYARGKKTSAAGDQYDETLTVEERVRRLAERLAGFLAKLDVA